MSIAAALRVRMWVCMPTIWPGCTGMLILTGWPSAADGRRKADYEHDRNRGAL